MSKFCIDLDGMALPDAIAAVVEAWYDAQNVESLIKKSNNALMPGDPIQIKDCASGTWEE